MLVRCQKSFVITMNILTSKSAKKQTFILCLRKNILPLFRKLKDCMKLNKLFVLNVKRSVIFKTGMYLGCNLHKT